jgi:hypothetical protein
MRPGEGSGKWTRLGMLSLQTSMSFSEGVFTSLGEPVYYASIMYCFLSELRLRLCTTRTCLHDPPIGASTLGHALWSPTSGGSRQQVRGTFKCMGCAVRTTSTDGHMGNPSVLSLFFFPLHQTFHMKNCVDGHLSVCIMTWSVQTTYETPCLVTRKILRFHYNVSQ